MSEKRKKQATEKQCTTARALIKDLCSNYDPATNQCIKRPDYPECPQMIAQSVCCSFFRDVLLEDKKGQLLKARLSQPDHIRRCKKCENLFRGLSEKSNYCARCTFKKHWKR